jgi:hypothetical protein
MAAYGDLIVQPLRGHPSRFEPSNSVAWSLSQVEQAWSSIWELAADHGDLIAITGMVLCPLLPSFDIPPFKLK